MKSLRILASFVLFLLVAIISINEIDGKALAFPNADPEALLAPGRTSSRGPSRRRQPKKPVKKDHPIQVDTNNNIRKSPTESQTQYENGPGNRKRQPQLQSESHLEPQLEAQSQIQSQSRPHIPETVIGILDRLAPQTPQIQEQAVQEVEEGALASPVDNVSNDGEDGLTTETAVSYEAA